MDGKANAAEAEVSLAYQCGESASSRHLRPFPDRETVQSLSFGTQRHPDLFGLLLVFVGLRWNLTRVTPKPTYIIASFQMSIYSGT